jgi:HflK protein
MNIKQNASITAVGLNVTLTVLKFVMYFFTGSLAILSEAWHSLTDIATSTLVYISLRTQQKREIKTPSAVSETKGKKKVLRDIFIKIKDAPLEYKVSFCIGILLLIVSVTLFKNFIYYKPVIIQYPLVSGIIFIGFSFGSYMIYKFETKIGTSEKSIGLISDGMHAKADMIMSLLIGFSLLFYKLGLNIDRFIALIIVLFIFSYAVETLVNVIISYSKREREYIFRYKIIDIIVSIFDKNNWIKAINFFKEHFPFYRYLKYVPLVFLIIFFCTYFSTSFYIINYNEVGVIERFGKPLNWEIPVLPGLHLKFPWPVDKVLKVKSSVIQNINIGNTIDDNVFALLWTKEHGDKEMFLSGDNNILLPYIKVHYQIKDVFKYLYCNKEPLVLLESISNRIFASIFSRYSFDDIISIYRGRLEKDAMNDIQEELDKINSGIQIISINIKDIHPPVSIAGSFERVIASYQEKERLINFAYKNKNKTIPEARGNAEEIIKNAESYSIKKVEYADGESKRFIMQIPSSYESRSINKSRLYLDKMKECLKDKRKIIIDPKTGIPEIWIDFNKILEEKRR